VTILVGAVSKAITYLFYSMMPSTSTYPLFYREFLAERQEVLRHKWLLSEKAGTDVGFERALTHWVINHREKWRKTRRLSEDPVLSAVVA